MTATLIHADVSETQQANIQHSRRLVQVSALVWYAFFRSDGGTCYWTKSIDGCATWSTPESIFSEAGFLTLDIWYERWFDAAADNLVHCFGHDDTADQGIKHVTLDLDTDTLGTLHYAFAVGAGPSMTGTSGTVSESGRIWASTGGTFFTAYETVYSEDDGANWLSYGSDIQEDIEDDWWELWPDPAADDPDDVVAFFFDYSANEFSVKKIDASAGITETVIATAVIDPNNARGNVAISLSPTTSHFRVAIVSFETPTTIRTFDVSGAGGVTVVEKTAVISATADVENVAISIFPDNDATVVYYERAGEIYSKLSLDAMVTWQAETRLNSVDNIDVRSLAADPVPRNSTEVAAAWLSNTAVAGLYIEVPTTPLSAAVTQFRLMLAETGDPNTPTLNITDKNIADRGQSLIKVARGRESAILGRPPRAGTAALVLNNYGLTYTLDQPTPGLAIRLNKKYNGTWYPMWTGPIDVPEQEMSSSAFRPIINIRANGVLSKLANKRVTTALLGRGVDSPTTTGAAINAVLDAADFPSSLRDIDAGDVTLPYFWANDEDALALLERLVNSEGITAELYENGAGEIVFRDRTARYDESRSSSIQTTFRAQGTTEPLLTGFEYVSGWREIVNYASHERYARTNDDDVTVVWEDDPDNDGYILGPNAELPFLAVGAQPFYNAITPVLNTDYAVGFGTVTVALDRTSGQRVTITFTAGPAGATIGQLQLRATTTILGATFQEHSGDYVDNTASVALYGVRPWTGEMSKELTWNDMRDNLDAIVTWRQTPRGRIRFGLNAAREGIELAEANEATAKREIGDRVRVITTDLDFDGELWIERIEHEVFSPAGTADGTYVGREFTWYECSVIEVAVGSQGTGVTDTNPYDAITHADNVLGTPLNTQGVMTMGVVGGVFFGAGP